ncbi:MAG: DNA-binding protein [Ruminococcaceae bacterium]|nr:DNA-binding protein [Oscillospiraceae bacterium]
MAANFYVSELLDRYGEILSEKQYRILDGYYNNDLSLSEIAENEGITRQGVSDFVKRTEAQLFEYEQKLHLCENISALKAAAENLKENKGNLQTLLDIIDRM